MLHTDELRSAVGLSMYSGNKLSGPNWRERILGLNESRSFFCRIMILEVSVRDFLHDLFARFHNGKHYQ
jgi:hypothetical protein